MTKIAVPTWVGNYDDTNVVEITYDEIYVPSTLELYGGDTYEGSNRKEEGTRWTAYWHDFLGIAVPTILANDQAAVNARGKYYKAWTRTSGKKETILGNLKNGSIQHWRISDGYGGTPNTTMSNGAYNLSSSQNGRINELITPMVVIPIC